MPIGSQGKIALEPKSIFFFFNSSYIDQRRFISSFLKYCEDQIENLQVFVTLGTSEKLSWVGEFLCTGQNVFRPTRQP